MAKGRDKNDSTMDISASQLVSGKRPQPPGVNKNDVSMWIGGVVGADDFAGPKKSPRKSRAPLAIGLAVLLAAAGGGAYYMFGRSSAPSLVAHVPLDATVATPPPIDAPPSVDASIPVDAAVDAAVGAPTALAADAVSGADPKPKPPKKKSTKKTVKKPVVKKRR